MAQGELTLQRVVGTCPEQRMRRGRLGRVDRFCWKSCAKVFANLADRAGDVVWGQERKNALEQMVGYNVHFTIS